MDETCIRIGAVNYLNTKPLIHELEQLAPSAELILDYPSRLADQMRLGQLDVALIPVIEFFRGQNYTLVPGISIASDGPVLSVTLFSRVPWTKIRRVALDEGSRTSAALTQVILRKRYDIKPEIVPLPLDQQLQQPNFAQFVITAKSVKDREKLAQWLEPELRNHFPAIRTRLSRLENGPPVGYPVQFRVSGDDIATVRGIAEKVAAEMRAGNGTTNVQYDRDEPSERSVVRPNSWVNSRTDGNWLVLIRSNCTRSILMTSTSPMMESKS